MPNCEQIRNAVDSFNASPAFESELALMEFLTSQHEVPVSQGRILGEICLIAEWGSFSHQSFSFAERIRAAAQVELRLPALEPLMRLTNDEWLADEAVIDHVVKSLNRILPLGPPVTESRQLAFMSKLLHWRVNRTFPPWDSRARKVLIAENIDVNEEPTWESYTKWWKQIRAELLQHQNCCLNAIRLPSENVVRTLDKALWWLGDPGA